MASTLAYAGSYSGYLPRETGQVVAFVRKTENFVLNRYIQWVPTDFSLGTYTVLERDQFVRVTRGGDGNAWEDGDARPMDTGNRIRHRIEDFRTKRRDFPWTLGYKTLEQTKSFKIKPAHMQMALSQAMTEITLRTLTLLQNSANWPSSSVADCNTLNGGKGKWSLASDDPSSPNYNAILLTLQAAAQSINLYTNAQVKPTDLRVIVSPNAAIKISATAEMNNYCRESPAAREILEKGLDPQFQLWGLPSTYHGYQFVVEDCPLVTEEPNTINASTVEATANRVRIKNDTTAIIVSRPGGLDGEYGAPSFSTVQAYHYGAMTQVEAFNEPKHRRIEGHVSSDVDIVLAAAIAGYLVQNIL